MSLRSRLFGHTLYLFLITKACTQNKLEPNEMDEFKKMVNSKKKETEKTGTKWKLRYRENPVLRIAELKGNVGPKEYVELRMIEASNENKV